MQRKKGISLIVLVITIIVMIILAAAIIISLTNNGIIGRANQAVDAMNLSEIQHLASVLWGEARLNGAKTDEEFKEAVTEGLKGVDTTNYRIKVTASGVTVKIKSTVDLPKELAVGDIVEYTPGKDFLTEWKVISIDRDEGTIRLVSKNVITDYNNTRITGAKAWNNSIKTINDACAPYGNTTEQYIATATSLTIEDVNEIAGYTPAEPTTSYNASDLQEGYNKFPIEYLKEKGVTTFSETELTQGWALNSSITIEQTAYTYVITEQQGFNEKFADWFVGNSVLASRGVSLSKYYTGAFNFCMFCFGPETVSFNDPGCLSYINGTDMGVGGSARPVVTMALKKELSLEKTEGTGDDKVNYWSFNDVEAEDVSVKGPWTKSGFTVTNGKESLQIGDTVHYDATKGGTISGLTSTSWKVLGADASGNLLIMSTKDVGTFGGTTTKEQWRDITSVLGAICEPYGKGTGAISVRSITADDVNSVTGYDKTTSNKYGVSRTYYYNGTNKDITYEETDGTTGKSWYTYTSLVYYNGTEFVTIDDFTSKTEGVMATLDYVDSYYYNTSSLTTISATNNKKAYTMLFGYNDAQYNLATRYQQPEFYQILAVKNGSVEFNAMNNNMWNSNGGTDGYANTLGVRAVVTLDKNVTLTGNSVSGWSL